MVAVSYEKKRDLAGTKVGLFTDQTISAEQIDPFVNMTIPKSLICVLNAVKQETVGVCVRVPNLCTLPVTQIKRSNVLIWQILCQPLQDLYYRSRHAKPLLSKCEYWWLNLSHFLSLSRQSLRESNTDWTPSKRTPYIKARGQGEDNSLKLHSSEEGGVGYYSSVANAN